MPTRSPACWASVSAAAPGIQPVPGNPATREAAFAKLEVSNLRRVMLPTMWPVACAGIAGMLGVGAFEGGVQGLQNCRRACAHRSKQEGEAPDSALNEPSLCTHALAFFLQNSDPDTLLTCPIYVTFYPRHGTTAMQDLQGSPVLLPIPYKSSQIQVLNHIALCLVASIPCATGDSAKTQ